MSIPFSKARARWERDAEFRKAHAELEEEFAIARMVIEARLRAGLTQKELAERMGTSQSAIARIEGGHRPGLKMLERIARATGSRLKISLEPADN